MNRSEIGIAFAGKILRESDISIVSMKKILLSFEPRGRLLKSGSMKHFKKSAPNILINEVYRNGKI